MEKNLLTVKKAKEMLNQFPDDMLLAWLDDETGRFEIPKNLIAVDISLDYVEDKQFKDYKYFNSEKDINNYFTMKCVTFEAPN